MANLLAADARGRLIANDGMMRIGEGVRLDNLYEKIDVAIPDAERSGHFGCFGTTRVGKAQPISAKVHTPDGFRLMRDIQPGDMVSTPDGGRAAVRAVFPQGELPIYKITFEDGRVVEASGDHLWEIHHKHWNGKYKPGKSRAGCAKPRILTTLQLKTQIRRNKGSFSIRLTKPPEQPKRPLPLHPYLLGCLLGDGLIGRGDRLTFCSQDREIVERLRTVLPPGVVLKQVGPRPIDYAFVLSDRNRLPESHPKHGNGHPKNPVKTAIVELGLSGSRSWEKHVPEDYLASSAADRLEILRGLLDTDGTVSKNGAVQFSTTSERLAKDVQAIVWSLGGIAKARKRRTHYQYKGVRKPGRVSYFIAVRHPEPGTLLTVPRKACRAPSCRRYRPDGLKLSVISVEKSGRAEAKCLLVDHPEHLYITDHFVVTHNTRLIENLIEQDVRKGYNVVVIDPKGDVELLSKIVQVAAESGRLHDLMYLTPIYPDSSIKLDPLAHYYMEDELVDHAVSGIKAKEDYFIAVATETTQAIVEALLLIARSKGVPPLLNFADIKYYADWQRLGDLAKAVEFVPDSKQVADQLSQLRNSPQDFFAKVSSSLRTTLSALTTGNTGTIIGKSRTNEFVERFERGQGVILYCNTGSMLARRTAHIVGRVLVSMIQSMVGRFFASGRKLDPPLCLHIDEGHNILYRGIQDLFAKGGGADVWVHIYTQSIAQMEEEIGREATKSIIDNINTWVFMLVNHPDTAKFIELSSPPVKKFEPILSFGGGISIREKEEQMIEAHRVMGLKKRQFYMRSYGKLYRGVTLDVTPRYVDVRFPQIRAV